MRKAYSVYAFSRNIYDNPANKMMSVIVMILTHVVLILKDGNEVRITCHVKRLANGMHMKNRISSMGRFKMVNPVT